MSTSNIRLSRTLTRLSRQATSTMDDSEQRFLYSCKTPE